MFLSVQAFVFVDDDVDDDVDGVCSKAALTLSFVGFFAMGLLNTSLEEFVFLAKKTHKKNTIKLSE